LGEQATCGVALEKGGWYRLTQVCLEHGCYNVADSGDDVTVKRLNDVTLYDRRV